MPRSKLSAMSPSAILQPIFAPLTTLKGVGPRFGKKLANLQGPLIRDLLWHLPTGLVDRRLRPKIRELPSHKGQVVTLEVQVMEHIPAPRRGLPHKVHVRDDSGHMELIFFKGKPDFWLRSLPAGTVKIISGKIDFYGGLPQMIHPDHIGNPDQVDRIATLEPHYPLTEGISNKLVRWAIDQSLQRLPQLPEWHDPQLVKQREWQDWKSALLAAHRPQGWDDLSAHDKSRERLAYDEILSSQLALALVRQLQRRATRPSRTALSFELRKKILKSLPFQLTKAQQEAIIEIDRDMQSEHPMLRMLQGDVGSGKTVVALLTMANTIETGKQAALMAPTEILARQHLQTIQPIADQAGLRVAALTGRDKGKARKTILEAVKNREIDILVGTHALLEDEVLFPNLGCVIIDEQHRFGVEQRLSLMQKNNGIDMLVMTATPIPRSLFLSIYGDLECSRLMEKPPGRLPIDTRTISLDRFSEVIEAMKRAIKEDRQIYWVCPLVEESEVLDLAAAEARHQELAQIFPGKVGLIHGRMKAKDKDKVMQDFAADKIKILVATTVIEVGVNVPNATIMVVDHAERFGLAQLHQLRGRIGRGSGKSTCLLLYGNPISQTAKARLAILRETEDGFRIAEEDLKLRGAGELLGTRQSGLPEMRFADYNVHQDLFKIAQVDVKMILEKDPVLQTERGKNLRLLLYLFDRQQAVAYLKSG